MQREQKIAEAIKDYLREKKFESLPKEDLDVLVTAIAKGVVVGIDESLLDLARQIQKRMR